jgi:hypothetical protein
MNRCSNSPLGCQGSQGAPPFCRWTSVHYGNPRAIPHTSRRHLAALLPAASSTAAPPTFARWPPWPPRCRDGTSILAKISILASWPPSSVNLTASVRAAFPGFRPRATPAARKESSSASFEYGRTRKCLISSDFSYTSPSSSFLRPVCSPDAAPYPVGKGSAAIRRTMLPKSRRVRWLSANSSR